MKHFKICAMIILLLVGIQSLVYGQTFQLKNGDTVTGELISFDGEVYRVRSKY